MELINRLWSAKARGAFVTGPWTVFAAQRLIRGNVVHATTL